MISDVSISQEAAGEYGGLHKEIIAYYDDCEVDYRIVWHLKNHLCLHYGYWESDTRRLREALRLMNLRLSELAKIRSSDVVLDAGCGVGGSAIYLAETYGCRVHGITLSEKQMRSARANAQSKGVDGLTRFDRADFCRSGFADASFDVVWAVESVCHAARKSDFLREARRLLRPNGRLIVADFFVTANARSSRDYEYVRKWADSWAVPEFASDDEFVAEMQSLGFEDPVSKDVSKNVYPTIRRLYQAFVPGLICSSALHLVGKRTARQWANTWSAYYQYKAFKRGLWRYQIMTARNEPGKTSRRQHDSSMKFL